MSNLSLCRFSLPLRDSVSIRPANGLYFIVGFGNLIVTVCCDKCWEGPAALFSRLKNGGQRFIAMYCYFPYYTTSRPISP